MSTSFTVHDLEMPVAKKLEIYAKNEGKSVNQSVKELLAVALGVSPKPRVKFSNGLSRYRGSVPKKDAEALLAFVADADFSKVDEENL